MITRIDTAPVPVLVIAAGSLTTSFAGNDNVNTTYGLDPTDGAGRACGPAIALANELALIAYKVQGSASEIRLQVQESDTEAFTIATVVPVAGSEWYTLTSAQSDSTYLRLPLIALRQRYFRVLAKYSGGAAASAAITCYAYRTDIQAVPTTAVALVGGTTGRTADVKQIDRVADEGLAYSAAIAVSAGTWLSDVVTFTATGHAWVAGDVITVSGCGNASYNGTYTVVSAATNTWTAALTPDPGAFTTAGSAIQAQSTTRLVDETKSWTANEWSTLGASVEITSGTGARQYRTITSNGTHWLAFAAMTTAPVTSDSTYNVVESGVNALVVDSELSIKLGSITVTNIDVGKYRSTEPDLAAGESAQVSIDIKGNTRVSGSEAHDATANRAPVRIAGYASDAAPSDVSDADVVNIWCAQNGAQVVAGYLEDGGLNDATAIPIGTDNAVGTDTTPDIVKVGGVARASGAAYTEADSAVVSFDLLGCLRIAGGQPWDAAASASVNPVMLGGYGSATITTAASANGDVTRLWTDLYGAQVVAGYDVTATAVKQLHIATDDSQMPATPLMLPVGGEYRATAITYTDGDATVLQTDVNGFMHTRTHGVSSGSILHGQKTVAVPGTEEAIAGSNTLSNGQSILIRAKTTNAGNVYVGGNPVTSGTGHILAPGEECTLAVNNTSLVYIDVDTAADGVSWIVEAG